MLLTLQIVALLQGLFLLIVVISRRDQYRKVNFQLLLWTIVSVMLYSMGDDDFNLFVEDSNWFLFHDSLMITFLFLLTKYHHSSAVKFDKNDFLFFVPHSLFVLVQLGMEIFPFQEETGLRTFNAILSLIFLSYLVVIIRRTLRSSPDIWMLFFIIPYSIVFIIDRGANVITNTYDSIPFLESYGVIGLSAFLFYITLFKLIFSPRSVLPNSEMERYKTSSLNSKMVDKYKNLLNTIMDEEKLYKNSKISVQDVAEHMGIPRQHLSEILNIHMKVSFQELINEYRVEEFIRLIETGAYENYSLLGIAYEAGFSSKATFYTIFKKQKGVTPKVYRDRFLNT